MPELKEKVLLDLRSALLKALNDMNLKYFGDHLAQKHNYKKHKGIDAVYFYLIEKYHWTPGFVRALSTDELLFLLTEEQHGWTLPDEVAQIMKQALEDQKLSDWLIQFVGFL